MTLDIVSQYEVVPIFRPFTRSICASHTSPSPLPLHSFPHTAYDSTLPTLSLTSVSLSSFLSPLPFVLFARLLLSFLPHPSFTRPALAQVPFHSSFSSRLRPHTSIHTVKASLVWQYACVCVQGVCCFDTSRLNRLPYHTLHRPALTFFSSPAPARSTTS